MPDITSETKELAISNPPETPQVYYPSGDDWKFMLSWGQTALKSGMLPSAVKTPEAAAVIVLKGRELGISFMTAIANIHVINGKPGMSAELIQGLARKNLPGLIINILRSDSEVAEIEFIRPERNAKPFVQKFTIQDAEKAKLLAKDVWKQYPGAMLWSRAVTAGLRKVCPEALMGVSCTPEELGANVDNQGNVIMTTGRHVEYGHLPRQNENVRTTPSCSSNEQSKPTPQPAKPAVATEIATEIFLIRKLQKELQISDADFLEMLHTDFQVQTMKGMSLDMLKKITQVLEDEKLARAKPVSVEEATGEWAQEGMGPIG